MKHTDHIALIILDGWGKGQNPDADAIAQASTPFMDRLTEQYPSAELTTFGEAVGLPDGQMGNSEVGHLNIGAGRIVYQELLRINNAIKDDSFRNQANLKATLLRCKENNKRLHLMGLVSDGGVHSHSKHLMHLVDLCDEYDVNQVFIHAFTDGRDVGPRTGLRFITELQNHCKDRSTSIATITGRYYAMDRDTRWERTEIAYKALVHAGGENSSDLTASIQKQYDQDITDEFLTPIINADVDGRIKDGDEIIFFNFRTDRPRQITDALIIDSDYGSIDMPSIDVTMTTMTSYDKRFKNAHVIFSKDDLSNTIGDILAQHGKTQLRAAETEKYPHVTFFLNGGREEAFTGEERIMIPSPDVATYDLKPEMSAPALTESVIRSIKNNHPNFICLNYANTDMVGHTGILTAAIKAAETVDNCLSRLIPALQEQDYEVIIIADHGNSDIMITPEGKPHTAHTTNPVPVLFLSNNSRDVRLVNGALCDIAPSLLSRLDIALPEEMTGKSLIHHD